VSPPVECPLCGEGGLIPKCTVNNVEWKGVRGGINCHYLECTHCGVEQADEWCLARNKGIMLEFKFNVDKDIKEWCDTL
jgi:hypothetical protein